MQTLAQSISTIAPTTSATITVPLVAALAGNGTWLAYVIALVCILFVAVCIAQFGRYSASPGSLYSYASESLPSWAGTLAAWSLVLAYICTGASVAGGFVSYAQSLQLSAMGRSSVPPLFWAIAVVAVSTFLACRDVEISTSVMLWIEGISALSITTVLLLVLARNGLHVDQGQMHLQSVTPGGVRLGLVLAVFSFVGFESATTLGNEVRNPLKTIPRAVILSALLGGAFFIVSAYTETMGFDSVGLNLGASSAPLRVLSNQAHLPSLGVLIDLGVTISLFAATLGCITAAARVMLRMAHDEIAHKWLLRGSATPQHAPVDAVILVAVLVMLPVGGLVLLGVPGLQICGLLGSAAVYGFLTAYALVCLALPVFLKRRSELSAWMIVLPAAAVLMIIPALIGTLYPQPPPPYNRLPYWYVLALAVGLISSWMTQRGKKVRDKGGLPETATE